MAKFKVTKKMIGAAADYVPLIQKQVFAQNVASLCVEQVNAVSEQGEPLPPLLRADIARRERCLLVALCGLYLGQRMEVEVGADGVGWIASMEEYDRIAACHPELQIRALTEDADVGNKCRALLDDYRFLREMVIGEIETRVLTGCDSVNRTAAVTSSALAKLPELMGAISQMSAAGAENAGADAG